MPKPTHQNPQRFFEAKPRLIRIKQAMDLTGLSRSYVYALAAEGKFPKSVSIVPGGSSRGWVEAEIQAWINQRIAERDQEV